MNIAFDIDGVVMKTYSMLEEKVQKQYNKKLNSYNHPIHIEGMDEEEITNVINELVEKYNHTIKPYKDTYKFLIELYDKYQESILFVSARPGYLKSITEDWFEMYFGDRIQYDIVCCDSGKNKIFHLEGYKYFVEDDPTYSELLSNVIDTVFLIDRPWNCGINPKNHPTINRIYTLSDLNKYDFSKGKDELSELYRF